MKMSVRGSAVATTVLACSSTFQAAAGDGESGNGTPGMYNWFATGRGYDNRADQVAGPATTGASLPLGWPGQQNGRVSAVEVDQYLASLEEPKRTTLARLRETILDLVPDADEEISYGVPAFKVRGKTIAGFAAFKNHLSYLPHSGSVFGDLRDDLQGYSTSSGALRFGIDEPLPAPLVAKLIEVRLRQAFPA